LGQFIGLTIAGLALGAIYAIAASGLVVTYTTSGVFNFAHGAIGMVMAFVYWQLRVQEHWSAPVALAVALLLVAPAIGLIIQAALIRRLNSNDLGMTLVVTLAVMVALMGIAFTLWPQTKGRLLVPFFGPNAHVSVGGQLVSYEELISIGLAVATAVGLRLFFYDTRIGVAMRGVVDDRQLMAMNGRSPAMLSALSWAIGAALGGLAGILTASTYSLDILNLTLLVLNSFAAAMLGRLQNLTLTFVGAILLGLADAYVTGYLRLTGWLVHLRPVLPTLFLFVVLLALPAVHLRAGRAVVSKSVRIPGSVRSLGNGAALVLLAIVIAPLLHGTVLGNVNAGVAIGIGALSIVLLCGYGGYVSLAQYAFFGFGAWLFSQTGHGGNPVGLLVAIAAGAILGVIVALPALRLRGLELALSTLAFGQLAYYMFFLQPEIMGRSDLAIARLHLPGLSLESGDRNLVFLTVVFALLSAGVLALRRSRFGRILVASKDSQVAVATLGLNLRVSKVLLFALATALATFGGALYGSTQRLVTADNFQYVSSLFIVLIVYVFGVSTPGAALAGGLSLAVAPLLAVHIPVRFQAVTYFMTGFGAFVLLSRPTGLIPAISDWVHDKLPRRVLRDTGGAPPLVLPRDATLPTVEVSRAAASDA
jgi:branched-chain amino acid transport system permease protein